MSEEQRPQPHAMPRGGWRTYLMPGLVIGFLGGHTLFIVIAISLATGDRSFAVVPDYYQKAVDWDDHKARLAASDALGWEAAIEPAHEVSLHGERALVVTIHDAQGRLVEGAEVEVTMYHRARAGDPLTISLAPDTPGRYTATAKMRDEGFWDFTLTARRGDQAFLVQRQQYVRGEYERGGGR